jgi:hypothetical protein
MRYGFIPAVNHDSKNIEKLMANMAGNANRVLKLMLMNDFAKP